MNYGQSIEAYQKQYGSLPEGVRPMDVLGLEKLVIDGIILNTQMFSICQATATLVQTAFPDLGAVERDHLAAAIDSVAKPFAEARLAYLGFIHGSKVFK